MKTVLVILLILASVNGIAQTYYYKANGKQTPKEAKAHVILELTKNADNYLAKKYTADNHQLIEESELESFDPYIEDGKTSYFDEKLGKLLAIGTYRHGELAGQWLYWKNDICDTLSYSLAIAPANKPKADTYLIVEEMPFFNYTTALAAKRKMLDQQLKSLSSTASDEDRFTIQREIIELNRTAFDQYKKEKLHYPIRAQRQKAEGIVYLNFVINEDGKVVEAAVVRGVQKDLDAEALRLIREMPSWTSGKQRGKSVRVGMTAGVKFEL